MVERKGKSRGLGRGLSSLMGDINNDPISSSVNSENQTLEKLVPVEKIYPNPNQPRKTFQEEKLIELANIHGSYCIYNFSIWINHVCLCWSLYISNNSS